MLYRTTKELAAFAAALETQGRGAATAVKYRREAETFLLWLGDRELTAAETAAYREHLAATRTASGANGAVSALNRFFAFLGRPDCRLRGLPVQRKLCRDEARELTAGEYKRLLSAARRNKRERLLLAMEAICATGIRVSELRFITVEAVRTGRATVTGKGKCREILLPGALRQKLKRYLKGLGRWTKCGDYEASTCSQPVFLTAGGQPLDRSNLWREMRTLCKAAGVDPHKVFPHNLRHLFAKTFYTLNKDIAKLADLLGHASIETTRIYIMETGAAHARLLERMHLLL